MKTTIMKVIVVAALSFNGTAHSAEEAKGKIQPPAAQPAAPAPPKAAEPAPPAPQPESKPPAPTQAKPARPKNLDLRHCLTLKTDAEIAKCAYE